MQKQAAFRDSQLVMRGMGVWHRHIAWWLLWVMAFAAAAPSVSKWLASNTTILVEVCNSQGVQRIAINLDASSTPETTVAADVHCGYCILQHHCPALPSEPALWGLPTVASHRLALGRGSTTVFQRFVRSAHHARAPPTFS